MKEKTKNYAHNLITTALNFSYRNYNSSNKKRLYHKYYNHETNDHREYC